MAVRPPSRAPRGKMTRRLAYLQIERCGPARPPIHGCVSLGPACTQGLSASSWTPRRHLCRSRIPESPQTRGTRVSHLAGSAGARGPVAPHLPHRHPSLAPARCPPWPGVRLEVPPDKNKAASRQTTPNGRNAAVTRSSN